MRNILNEITRWEDSMQAEGLAPSSAYQYGRTVRRLIGKLPSPDTAHDPAAVAAAAELAFPDKATKGVGTVAWARWARWARGEGLDVAPWVPGGTLPRELAPVVRAARDAGLSWRVIAGMTWGAVQGGLQVSTVRPDLRRSFRVESRALGDVARAQGDGSGAVDAAWLLVSRDGRTPATRAQMQALLLDSP